MLVGNLGVLFAKDEIFSILFTGFLPFGDVLENTDGVECLSPLVAAPANSQVAAVLIGELKKVCEVEVSLLICSGEVGLIKAPELLAVVKADEVGIFLEELLKQSAFKALALIVVGEVTLSA